ncbi:mblk-1-related factor 1-like [Diabrotica virgifera virgifera]|uniref:Mblk-1-related factor 1-like isoform X1 n=1 Tax=Diabrotica virgifera virgifera TaxID=50390 RepID=A0A6P7HA29_DIAVI|nr:mblk-1-related factor 1-like [Diabrotica virgifera virgifera]
MPKLRKYDKNKLIEAVKDVQNGTESYRTAEKKYGIPKSTIEFKLKHPEHKDTLGPSPILTCEEENTLVRWIQETASKGFPKKANDLKSSVQKFLTENPRPNNFKHNRPGDGWLKVSRQKNVF